MNNYYQAVGAVRGIYADGLLHIRQGQYPAIPVGLAKRKFSTLGSKPQRFLIYPRYDLKTEALRFQIVGWTPFSGDEDEWKLAGLWQFIPQCRRPVLAIHRNSQRWRGDELKSSYVPFIWTGEDSPRPWRFDPRVPKEMRVKPTFLSCTATLDKKHPRFFLKDVLHIQDHPPARARPPKKPYTAKSTP